MLTFFAGIATFEREIMLQRQREGIAIAKKAGKYKGRLKKARPKDWETYRDMYYRRELTATALAKRCKVSRPTIYLWLKEDKNTKALT